MGGLRAAQAMVRTTARRIGRVGGFALVTGAMLPAYAIREALADDASRDGVRDRWVAAWSDALLRLFGVRAEVDGDARAEPGVGRLVVANHRSTIDIAILL